MFKPRKPTRPKKVGDTEGNDVDMDIEGNGSCLEITIYHSTKCNMVHIFLVKGPHNIKIAEFRYFLFHIKFFRFVRF